MQQDNKALIKETVMNHLSGAVQLVCNNIKSLNFSVLNYRHEDVVQNANSVLKECCIPQSCFPGKKAPEAI